MRKCVVLEPGRRAHCGRAVDQATRLSYQADSTSTHSRDSGISSRNDSMEWHSRAVLAFVVSWSTLVTPIRCAPLGGEVTYQSQLSAGCRAPLPVGPARIAERRWGIAVGNHTPRVRRSSRSLDMAAASIPRTGPERAGTTWLFTLSSIPSGGTADAGAQSLTRRRDASEGLQDKIENTAEV